MELISNRSTCPNCGALAHRWQTMEGRWVCDECWLDVAMDQQHHKFKLAKDQCEKAKEPKTSPWTSGTARRDRHKSARTNPAGGTSGRLPYGGLDVQGRVLGSHARVRTPFKRPLLPQTKYAINEVVHAGTNSVCLMCSHIFYGAAMKCCTRCGGAIHIATDSDLKAMARYSVQCIEEDVFQ